MGGGNAAHALTLKTERLPQARHCRLHRPSTPDTSKATAHEYVNLYPIDAGYSLLQMAIGGATLAYWR